MVETLKEFCTILLGHELNVFTDHKNLVHKTHNCERVTRWRSLLEDYGPNFMHMPRKKNVAADVLSRLDVMDADVKHRKLNQVPLCDITNEQEMTCHCDPNPSCMEQC